MQPTPIYQVDAFTDEPFRGNPAAVCLLAQPLGDATLQAIAAEMNLSETAFLCRADDVPWQKNASFSLRWFTPMTEVPLCGHATLASAAVLFREVGIESPNAIFRTLSGPLTARKKDLGCGPGTAIALDFPADPPRRCEPPDDVVAALGLPRESVLGAAYGQQTRKLLLQLADADLVSRVAPDFGALLTSESMRDYRGLAITAEGPAPYDFVSRFFAPWVGIDEDPVTGSSHTVLTPYWAERLGKGTPEMAHMRARQASARGGDLWVKLLADQRVEIAGSATVVMRGRVG